MILHSLVYFHGIQTINNTTTSHYSIVSEFYFLLKICCKNTNITNTMADCYSNW